MLTLDDVRAQARHLPTLFRLGLLVMALALFADVIAHLEVPAPVTHTGDGHVHTTTQLWAHAGVFVGMVIVFAGVVIDGVRHTHTREAHRCRSETSSTSCPPRCSWRST